MAASVAAKRFLRFMSMADLPVATADGSIVLPVVGEHDRFPPHFPGGAADSLSGRWPARAIPNLTYRCTADSTRSRNLLYTSAQISRAQWPR